MAYTPTEWACGDTVTAEKMNAMERGIAEMNAEYVPNEWACGDVITAEKLNHMEQGIANGGGGGSSDFSTAQVTIVNNLANENVEVSVAHISEDSLMFMTYADRQSTITLAVALYKGVSFGALGQIISDNVEITATGGIEMDETDFMVTSNGTITIS